MLMDNNYFNVL